MTMQREPGIAARLPDDAANRQKITAYLHSQGLDSAKRFAEKDDDELNAAIVAGDYKQVIFANLDELLVTIWKGETQWDRWRSSGIEVILVNPPAAPDWLSVVDAAYASISAWRSIRRRRQIIAAVILSVIALAAMFVLFYWVPPPR
ncbi:hypothetical protein B7486_11685 [cyanobacterium TDX16]|nr:hypothetical protein B7486_11685 [cyanobacterium TDX16]